VRGERRDRLAEAVEGLRTGRRRESGAAGRLTNGGPLGVDRDQFGGRLHPTREVLGERFEARHDVRLGVVDRRDPPVDLLGRDLDPRGDIREPHRVRLATRPI
jgi:hypothetical protein